MPKSLIEKVKELPPVNRNQSFVNRLSPEQQKEYQKVIKFVASQPPHDRPKFSEIRRLLLQELGDAPCDSTFRKEIERAELCPQSLRK